MSDSPEETSPRRTDLSSAWTFGFIAYGWWGLVPLYFRLFHRLANPMEILAHRIVWSAILLGLLVVLIGRASELLKVFRDQRLFFALGLSALLIGANWYVYILSVQLERIVDASLGYFITPLVSVLLGVVFFREKLRPMQVQAIIIAGLGVAVTAYSVGSLPWISLSLACSFSLYGVVRKMTAVDGLIGLTVETIVLAPLAMVFFGQQAADGTLVFSRGPWWLGPLLVLAGPITAVPLMCFAQAARALPLSSLGFLQYTSPTIQMLLAMILWAEPFPRGGEVAYPLIWLALAIFSYDAWRNTGRKNRAVAPEPDAASELA